MPEDADAVYEVLSLADQRLYTAKRRGRDQVVVSA
jgi:PleD family two-component response regulator